MKNQIWWLFGKKVTSFLHQMQPLSHVVQLNRYLLETATHVYPTCPYMSTADKS